MLAKGLSSRGKESFRASNDPRIRQFLDHSPNASPRASPCSADKELAGVTGQQNESTEVKVGAFVVVCVALDGDRLLRDNARFSAQIPYRTYLRNAQGMEPARPSCLVESPSARSPLCGPTTDPTRMSSVRYAAELHR